MNEMKHSSAGSVTAFVLGALFIVASLVLWGQTDLQNGEAIFGGLLGLGCLVWGLTWVAIGGSSSFDQLTVQATALIAAAMAVMVGVGYLTWERAGLYLLEALAVVAIALGVVYRRGQAAGRPESDPADATNRSAPSFVVGVAFVVASIATWNWTDVPQSEVFWGIWLGAGCWAWTFVWAALSRSSAVEQVVAWASGLVAVVMASMAAVDYLTWDRAGLYLLEALAVVATLFGCLHWLDQLGPARAQSESSPAPT